MIAMNQVRGLQALANTINSIDLSRLSNNSVTVGEIRQSIDDHDYNIQLLLSKVDDLLSRVSVLEGYNILASPSEPTDVAIGTVWFDTSNRLIKVKHSSDVWIGFSDTVDILLSQQRVFKDFLRALTTVTKEDNLEGKNVIDVAIQATSTFADTDDLIDNFLRDLRRSRVTPQTFLLRTCGINLENDDTGSILGIDAGGTTGLNKEDVIDEDTSHDPVYPPDAFRIVDVGLFRIKKINGVYFLFPDPTNLDINRRKVIRYLSHWIIPAALTTIEKAYGFSFNSSFNGLSYIRMGEYFSTSAKMIPVMFSDSEYCPVVINENTMVQSVSGISTNLCKAFWTSLIINENYFGSITDDPSGYSPSAGDYLDRCITHELSHSLLATSLVKYSSSQLDFIDGNVFINEPYPSWFMNGITDLVHGIDDYRSENMIELCDDPEKMYNALVNNDNTEESYSAGFILLRYFLKQVSEGNDRVITGRN